MGYSEMNCPHCGKMNRESCNAWMYGSPIKVCKSCGQKYLDSRYREPAVSGLDQRSVDPKFYLKGMGIFVAATVFVAVWLWYSVYILGHYNTRQVGILALCGFAAAACLVLYIRIKLGLEDKSNARLLAESEERLKDPGYVQELISYGYNVPEKYR